MEKQTIFPTTEGTPQGGVISPLLANMALDGLEAAIQRAKGKGSHRLHVVRYADDFVVMGATKELLESQIKPAIVEFLKEKGLELSLEKTQITSIDKGFDFLGFNIRKYQDKLLIKPSKESVLSFLGGIRQLIKSHPTIKADELISMLNPKIRGWAYYHRHVVAKRIFGYVDDCIYRCLSHWTRRRHPNKNFDWIGKKYFHRRGNYNWIFFGTQEKKDGSKVVKDLEKASYIPIKRYIKIRSEATPYDRAYIGYLANRKQDRNNKLYHYWKVSTLNLFGEAQWIDLKLSARSF